MKIPNYLFLLFAALQLAGCNESNPENTSSLMFNLNDLSGVRGFNYTPANVAWPRHHVDTWVHYDSTVTEFDLDLAVRLKLNQVRVFVPYLAYEEDKEALTGKLRHFTRECDERGIGVMPVVGHGGWVRDSSLRPLAREWAEYLVNALSDEPGLVCWDVMNEPDWPTTPRERVEREFENSKMMAELFHELDPETPVTIGCAFVDGMIEMADQVDVLQFHDYSQTRDQIKNNITRAKKFAAQIGKPLINGEIGCIARANPYDITLQEHMEAKVGWYIWELMIVRKGWGEVHGVFYEDGAVRDPSIAAAILGFFRKRDENILPAVPDKEGWVTRIVERSTEWLQQPDAEWEEGLDYAETAAHLMEAGEIVPMDYLPTREVYLLRQGEVDMPVLQALLKRYIEILKPHMVEDDK